MKERMGLIFFTFATVFAFLAAWEQPGILAWLAVVHNAVLTGIYTRRKPARDYDRIGLWLGLLAALLPLAAPYPRQSPWPVVVIGLTGYAIVLWSLFTLGSHFGIAPADRGMVTSGPYRWVRHPMYLGELVLRSALVAPSPQVLIAAGSLAALAAIQILRSLREERILEGYPEYANRVGYRLIPGIW
jgi:protein-S-isoprenylcysteine O-methyltransferase Ste14